MSEPNGQQTISKLMRICDQSHISYDASDKYHTMQHFVTEICTHVPISIKNGVLWDMGQLHCGICEFGLLSPEDTAMYVIFNGLGQTKITNIVSEITCRLWVNNSVAESHQITTSREPCAHFLIYIVAHVSLCCAIHNGSWFLWRFYFCIVSQ